MNSPTPPDPAALFPGEDDMAEQWRTLDWGATPLGPVPGWPASLRTVAGLVLSAAFPTVLLWGEELVQLYNGGYRELMGAKHPSGLGQPTRACWPEVWHLNAPVYARVLAGETVVLEDALFPVDRSGALEDAWFTLSYAPVRGEEGTVAGVLVTVFETTARVRARGEREAERERLLAGSEAARRQVTATLESISDAFYAVDAEFRFTYVNRKAEALWGRRREELLGRDYWKEFPAAVGSESYRQHLRVMAERRSVHFEALSPVLGRWLDVSLYPDDASGGLACYFRDATARKEAEEALLRSRERQAFLLRLADRLGPINDPARIQREAARALGEHLGASRVGYAEMEPDGVHVAVTHNYADGVPSIEGRHRVTDYSPALLDALNRGETFVRGDIANDARLSPGERATHAALQVAATVDLPLIRDGRLVAVVFMHRTEPHAWPDEEIALLRDVAARTWDAVERARAVAALRESEAKYRQIFDSIDEGLAVVEMIFDGEGRARDYRFVSTNLRFGEQTGLVDVLGRTARELVPGLEEHWFETYGRVATTGEPVRFENGSESMGRWFDVFAFRVGGAPGRQVGVLFRDKTAERAAHRERERLLAEARAARADAEAANRSKSEFLAVMSHELRTPLNAIGGYAELIEMGIHGPVTEAQRAALARVQQSQRHLLGLINGVLNYARVDAGAVRYDLADVPVAEALAAAEALVLPQARARGLTAVLGDCAPGLAVRADPDKLQQVLLNLLANAVKFTDPGGEIRVTCAEEDASVSITVADTGIGIAPEKLAGIFDPFVQVDQRLTRPHEGVGLGLAISRELARGMAGDLRAASTPGVGSAFTLTLPRA